MKRMILCIGIMAITLLFCNLARAEQAVAIGGLVHNGHSYSSDNKIDPPGYVGHGLRLQWERGIDDERGFDFTYLFGIDAIRFGKRNNFTMRSKWKTALTGTLEGRVYSRHNDYFQPFVGVAVGNSLASDEHTACVAGAFGIETRLDDALSIETVGRVTATETRRHDTYGILLKWRF